MSTEMLSSNSHIFLFRLTEEEKEKDAEKILFMLDAEVSMSIDNEETKTWDGTVNTPSKPSQTISMTSKGYRYVNEPEMQPIWRKLEDCAKNRKRGSLWKINTAEISSQGVEGTEGEYFEGYFTSFNKSYPDGSMEISSDFAVDGLGVYGKEVLDEELIKVLTEAQYDYKSIKALG